MKDLENAKDPLDSAVAVVQQTRGKGKGAVVHVAYVRQTVAETTVTVEFLLEHHAGNALSGDFVLAVGDMEGPKLTLDDVSQQEGWSSCRCVLHGDRALMSRRTGRPLLLKIGTRKA